MSLAGAHLVFKDDSNTRRQENPINTPSASNRRSKSGLSLPSADLLDASIRGDWQAVKVMLDLWPELVWFGITETSDTALHVAASAENTKLIIPGSQEMMPLCIDALFGNRDMANTLYDVYQKIIDGFRTTQNWSWVLLKCVKIENVVFAVVHLKVGLVERDGQSMQLLRIILGNTMKNPKADMDDVWKAAIDPPNEDEME